MCRNQPSHRPSICLSAKQSVSRSFVHDDGPNPVNNFTYLSRMNASSLFPAMESSNLYPALTCMSRQSSPSSYFKTSRQTRSSPTQLNKFRSRARCCSLDDVLVMMRTKQIHRVKWQLTLFPPYSTEFEALSVVSRQSMFINMCIYRWQSQAHSLFEGILYPSCATVPSRDRLGQSSYLLCTRWLVMTTSHA